MGDCLACGYGTYSTPDGNVPAVVGNRTLVVLKEDGKRIRMCYGCSRTETGLASARENAKDRDDTGPIEWPEDKRDLRLRQPASKTATVADDEDDDDPDPF
jgi:hypothetical protein